MPCSSSIVGRVAISDHPGPEPRQLVRLLVIGPTLFVEPCLCLSDVPRVGDVGGNVGRVILSTADDDGGFEGTPDRGLEFEPRRLFRVRVRAPGGIGLPKHFKRLSGQSLYWFSFTG